MNLKTWMACGLMGAAAVPAAAQVYEGRTPAVVQDRDTWWYVYTADRSDDLRVPGQPESRGPDLYDWAYDYMYDDYYDFDEFPGYEPIPEVGATARVREIPGEGRVYGIEERVYVEELPARRAVVREEDGVRVDLYERGRGATRVYGTAGEYGLWSEYDDGADRVYFAEDDDFEIWYDAD